MQSICAHTITLVLCAAIIITTINIVSIIIITIINRFFMIDVIVSAKIVYTFIYGLLTMYFTIFTSQRHCCLKYNSPNLIYCASIIIKTFYRIFSQVGDSTSYLCFFHHVTFYLNVFITLLLLIAFVTFVNVGIIIMLKFIVTFILIPISVFSTHIIDNVCQPLLLLSSQLTFLTTL